MHRNAPPCQSRFGVSFAGAPSGSRFQLSLLIRLWRGNSARLIDARPCVAGRLARSSRRSRTEDKMASRPLSCNKRCPGTTLAVAPPADSRAHLFGASSRASGCRLPQTIAETRVPTVRRPFPRRRGGRPFTSLICASLPGGLCVFCACTQRQSAVIQIPILNVGESRIPAHKLSAEGGSVVEL
jgi:hypothetical protein